MIQEFNVQVHENGVVLTPLHFGGTQRSLVFEKDHIEDALSHMYRYCVDDWKVGDCVKVIRKEV